MSTTRYSNAIRPGTLAATVVLGLGLLAGCSEPPSAAPNAGNTPQSGSEAPAASEQHEVVFSVPGMDCPMCPITVKRALSNVDGILEAEADIKTKQARAIFDPSRTDTDALIAAMIVAIENSGFSAHLTESEHE